MDSTGASNGLNIKNREVAKREDHWLVQFYIISWSMHVGYQIGQHIIVLISHIKPMTSESLQKIYFWHPSWNSP